MATIYGTNYNDNGQMTYGPGPYDFKYYRHLSGTSGDDQMYGLAGNDYLYGYDGNDLLDGGSGADYMDGGAGNDTYIFDSSDTISDSGGIDAISHYGSYTLGLGSSIENLNLIGTSNTSGTGNGNNNIINGNSAVNQISGGSGNDILDGGLGTDSLTGGINNDIFKFTTKGSIDTITDYNVSDDTVQLENGVFTALSTTGTLAASQFKVGTQAADANDFIIYDNTTGTLLYDADGSGITIATQIASLSAGLELTNADIFVI